jgi:hypothetical protein
VSPSRRIKYIIDSVFDLRLGCLRSFQFSAIHTVRSYWSVIRHFRINSNFTGTLGSSFQKSENFIPDNENHSHISIQIFDVTSMMNTVMRRCYQNIFQNPILFTVCVCTHVPYT